MTLLDAHVRAVVKMAGTKCMVADCDARCDVLIGHPLPEGGFGFIPACGACALKHWTTFLAEAKP